ncbi:MAG TPA: universal stress protein [Burkholderiales bacterium]|nr:universal stress protein [Burkholderiales bacterium]
MFQHILLPLDGSTVSRKAARKAIALAKQAGARITAYHALGSGPRGVYGDGYRLPPERSSRSRLRKARVQWFDGLARAARDAGVRFATAVDRAFTPHEGIVAAAQKRKCDLIVIGSHGRRGLARLALGSVAENVIARSSVPVLVYR